MDIDSPLPPATAQEAPLPSSHTTPVVTRIPNLSNGDDTASSPVRAPARILRARQSLPQSSSSTLTPASSSKSNIRPPSQKELDVINKRLGQESLRGRREELIKEKEAKLRMVVDEHDTAVREKFHLERYISLLEGWDPKMAKQEVSPVFQDYKREHHNLLSLLPPSASSSVAGPSRPRTSLPARTTRRQIHEQSEIFAVPAPTPQPVSNGRAILATKNGKGKAKAEESEPELTTTKGKSKQKEDGSSGPSRGRSSVSANGEMPPPPVPVKKGKHRRVTMGASLDEVEEVENIAEEPLGKAKKKARLSLPDLAATKKFRGKQATEEINESSPVVASPAVDPPDETTESSPPPTPAPLPSLAHLPFQPPPFRPRERITGPKEPWYTDPTQLPPPSRYNGDLVSILQAYIHIEDTGPQLDIKALELRAAREAYFRNRVNYLQHQGRMTRLLDESDEAIGHKKSHQKAAGPPPRASDHQDFMLSHMIQVRNAMMNEAKGKPVVCKRIARMIMAHWEREEGKDERERLAEERERKRKMKEITRALKKRWGLAVKIIRARVIEKQKQEQDRLGKEHLQNMLQRSTGLLEAQRDDIAGYEQEEEDEEEDNDQSDGTEEVSVAEDSSEGAGEEGDSDVEMEDLGGVDAEEQSSNQGIKASDDEEAPGREDDDGNKDAADDSGQEDSDEEEIQDPQTSLQALLMDQELIDNVDLEELPAVEIGDINSDPAQRPVDSSLSTSAQSAETVPPISTDELVIASTSNPDLLPVDVTSHLINGRVGAGVGVPLPVSDAATEETASEFVRARRARKSRSVSVLVKTEDPDASDIDFDDAASELSEQDHQLDVEMEDEEEDVKEADSEDEGLLADADAPIEELLKRYGYPVPSITEINETKDVVTDKSLLDESLEKSATSPGLVVEGKRNRRVRSVWTPEDNPPPPPKRPKIEEVQSEIESTPELSSDEDDDDDDEDGDDDEAEIGEPEDPNRVRPPFLLRGTLRPYQQAGLEWLASLYTNKMNGILADEMGLGKTIQTISLLGHLACDKGVWGQHLIIVPTSVILNWEMEFKKFLPGMKVLTYYGNQKERKEKRRGWHTENTWQVCITSYQIVLADQHIFRRKSWVYMILDEAHNIKNFRSQRWQTLLGFKAQRRLLLTGTPLQNNLMELWSLLYFLMPNGVTADATAVVGFANHKEFSEWFSNPMDKAVETGDVLDEETLETVSKLHTLLRPFILRRLKSEVETQLPGKFEHVVYCRLSKRQRFLYDEFMSRASTREALSSGGYLGVVNTLMQLRKVCNHPDLFEVRPVRTSFAMERSILGDFEPQELLIRRRLQDRLDELDLEAWNLNVTGREGQSAWTWRSTKQQDASDLLPHAIEPIRRGKQPAPPKVDTRTVEGWLKYREYAEEQASIARWRHLRDVNRVRCAAKPIYGSTFLNMLGDIPNRLLPGSLPVRTKSELIDQFVPPVAPLIHSFEDRAKQIAPTLDYYAVIPPTAVARDLPQYALPGLTPTSHPDFLQPEFDTLHQSTVKLQIAFPDASLLQYDCGKLQKLDEMLRHLKSDGHRVLIFTQMTRVLDILEMFLSYNGHRYLRLDGSTKIEDRQIITERFNSDSRIFCFIASSRSGGVGINLTGADTVFFYDSDWNPSMDRQCMDRAHRIGQTREVHIYRFVSSHTVEENMLKKANQKRLLDKVVIQEGEFTTDFFGKMDWRDIIQTEDLPTSAAVEAEDRVEDVDVEGTPVAVDTETVAPRLGEEREFAKALAEVEDEEDVEAARVAQGEGEMDFAEFAEGEKAVKRLEQQRKEMISKEQSGTPMEGSATPQVEDAVGGNEDGDEQEEEEEDDEVGAVDEYMLRLVEWEWDEYFSGW